MTDIVPFPTATTTTDHGIVGPDGPLGTEFSDDLLRSLNEALRIEDKDPETAKMNRKMGAQNALLAFVPSEPTEAMLAAQAVAAHHAAMDCLKMAMRPFQPPETVVRLRSSAHSMIRAQTHLLRALERHRGWPAGKKIFRDSDP
jgi:hypothetical protein